MICWISTATTFHPVTGGDDERTGGAPVWALKNSENQFLVLFQTVRVIIRQRPCTLHKRHLAFFYLVVEKRLALWRGSSRDPMWVCLLSARLIPSVLRLVQIKFNPKVQFGSDLMEEWTAHNPSDAGFQRVSHTAKVPEWRQATNHAADRVAELGVNTWRLCRTMWKISVLTIKITIRGESVQARRLQI